MNSARIQLEGRLEIVEAAAQRALESLARLTAPEWGTDQSWHQTDEKATTRAIEACRLKADAPEVSRALTQLTKAQAKLEALAKKRLCELDLFTERGTALMQLQSHTPFLVSPSQVAGPQPASRFDADVVSNNFEELGARAAIFGIAWLVPRVFRPKRPRFFVTQRFVVCDEAQLELSAVRLDARLLYLSTWSLVLWRSGEPVCTLQVKGEVEQWVDVLRQKGIECSVQVI